MNNLVMDVKHVSIEYGGGKPVVKDVNLAVRRREIIGIVGESGSGKSTLLRAVLGLLPPGGQISAGEIIFKGQNLLRCSREEWREIRGNRIALVFQDAGKSLNPIRKIGSQLIESIRSHFKISKTDAYDKALDMLEKMRLPDGPRIMNSYSFQLSGGMKQRVAIAIAMTLEPELLLSDEPTSSLDATIQTQVVRELMELRNHFDTSIILVTHNIGIASYISDQICVMRRGEFVERGAKTQVIHNPRHEYTAGLLSAVPELGGPRLV
jgi:peptide/nickel transport system ATP-binding protein